VVLRLRPRLLNGERIGARLPISFLATDKPLLSSRSPRKDARRLLSIIDASSVIPFPIRSTGDVNPTSHQCSPLPNPFHTICSRLMRVELWSRHNSMIHEHERQSPIPTASRRLAQRFLLVCCALCCDGVPCQVQIPQCA
jgi:hypothetical protein